MTKKKKGKIEEKIIDDRDFNEEPPEILEEIEIEDLTVDGICGVYIMSATAVNVRTIIEFTKEYRVH